MIFLWYFLAEKYHRKHENCGSRSLFYTCLFYLLFIILYFSLFSNNENLTFSKFNLTYACLKYLSYAKRPCTAKISHSAGVSSSRYLIYKLFFSYRIPALYILCFTLRARPPAPCNDVLPPASYLSPSSDGSGYFSRSRPTSW